MTGAVVAAAINRPILALPAAILSHFAVDSLPHWNYKVPGHAALRPIVIGIDMILSTVVLAVLAWSFADSPRLVFIGGFLAILPDATWAPYILWNKPSPRDRNTPLHILHRFHIKIQWSETSIGLFVELAWLVFMLMLFFYIAS